MHDGYPRATPVGRESMSALTGGGGQTNVTATSDDPADVVRYFAELLGPPTETTDVATTWQSISHNGGWRITQFTDVWTGDTAPVPGFDAQRVPAGSRAIIVTGSVAAPNP